MVLDLKSKRKFGSIPRNVGGMRDFNRVAIDGVDPEIIEKAQSNFEGKAATALKKLEETSDFSGETKDVILELIGMLAIKSPERREHLAKPLAQIANLIMAMTFESEERWESQIYQIKQNTGNNVSDGATFDKMKDLYERGAFEISVSKEHQINMELIGTQGITELLHKRNWVLLKAAGEAGEFITADNPVSLTFNNPTLSTFISPGFGLQDTTVYFPVSKNLALIGEFDGTDSIESANKHLVAILNSRIIANSYQRVFASKSNFNYIAKDGAIKLGNTLV